MKERHGVPQIPPVYQRTCMLIAACQLATISIAVNEGIVGLLSSIETNWKFEWN